MDQEKMQRLISFFNGALTAYHAKDCLKALLIENGFEKLLETEDFALKEGGKYFVERGAALIAFTVGSLDHFSYKIVASHLDSPCLKLKANPLQTKENAVTLNVETYGGGIWHTFFDRPLKIAGRVILSENGALVAKTVVSPFNLTIPSMAIHINRGVNDGFAINAQTDLAPLLSLRGNEQEWLAKIAGDQEVVSYDLFVVNADMPYAFGLNDEFFATPRADDLASARASVEALLNKADSDGVCVMACLTHEEIGSNSAQGAAGDFLENVLRRIGYAFHFDDNEFYKALASSFLLSVDNAHAVHPNHPEKSDPTNRVSLGGGIAIKSHAGGAYATDAMSDAVVKTVFERAGVAYQYFYNRSDMRSGSTMAIHAVTRLGVSAVDIGLPQLAMHSACECFALTDYDEMVNGLTAFFSSDILATDDGFVLR